MAVIVSLAVTLAVVACRGRVDVDEPGAPPRAPQPADDVLGVDRDATFAGMMKALTDVEHVSPDGLARLDTTLADEEARARTLFENAVTRDDAYVALVAWTNTVHDGHLFADFSDTGLYPARPPVGLPIALRAEKVEDGAGDDAVQFVVVAVDDGGAGGAGGGGGGAGGGGGGAGDGAINASVNDVVVAVDGVAIADVTRAFLSSFSRGSSPDEREDELARFLTTRFDFDGPLPEDGATTTWTIARGGGVGGETDDVTLTWRALDSGGGGGGNGGPSLIDRCGPIVAACDDALSSEGREYAGKTPTFIGLNTCAYDTDDADTALVRTLSFFYPDDPACFEPKRDVLSYDLRDADIAAGPHELLVRDLGALVDALRAAGKTRVIFDVRDNGGGDFDPAFFAAFASAPYRIPMKALAYGDAFKADPSLIRQSDVWLVTTSGQSVADPAAHFIADLAAAPDAAFSTSDPFYCTTLACDDDEANYEPAADPLRAVLLTGPACFSACDDFVSIFAKNGMAKLVGVPTGAGDAPYHMFVDVPLEDGSAVHLRLTVGVSFHPHSDDESERTTLEGHPADVDVPLPKTAANRGHYLDALVSAALALE